jgi:hypothetical protein
MFKLASSIGLALAVAELRLRIRHWIRSGIFGVVGAVILVIAICFLLVALHLYLSGLLNPIASAAIIGGVLLLIAIVLFFLASRPMRSASAPAAKPVSQTADTFSESLSRLGQMGGAGGLFANPLVPIAGVALVVGYLLGRRGRRSGDDKRDKEDD